MNRPLTKNQVVLRNYMKDNDFNPKQFLMKRMILVKKYSYQITNAHCYWANLCVDSTGKYLQIQNAEYVQGMSPAEVVQNKTKLWQFELSDITGFIFGANSVRFWMQRQAINEIISTKRNQKECEDMLPYFSWECLTIQFKRRDVDIVVRDELQMEILLKFLIQVTNSFDGNTNSLDFLKQFGIIHKNLTSQQVMNRVYAAYMVMRIRMKLNYESARRKSTFQEVWLQAILKTYMDRQKAGLISNPWPKPKYKLIDELNNLGLVQICFNINEELADDIKFSRIKRKLTAKEQLQERQVSKFSMKLLGMSVFKTDKVDDMFQIDGPSQNTVTDDLDTHHLKNKSSSSKVCRQEAEHIMRKRKKECFSNLKGQIQLTESKLILNKLTLIKRLQFTKGPLYIIILLQLIKMHKIVFLSEIQRGDSIRIPDYLTMKFHESEESLQLPQSLRFYDNIYCIVKSEINEDKVKLFVTQLEKARSIAEKIDPFKSLEQQVKQLKQQKVEPTEKERRGMTFFDEISHQISLIGEFMFQKKNNMQLFEEYLTKDVNAIQSAKHIELDSKNLRQRKHYSLDPQLMKKYSKAQQSQSRFEDIIKNDNNFDNELNLKNPSQILHFMLNYKYISSNQVERKKQNTFIQKVIYQNKLQNLKEKGKRLIRMGLVDEIEQMTKKQEFAKTLTRNRLKGFLRQQMTQRGRRKSFIETQQMDQDQRLYNFFKKCDKIYEEFEDKTCRYQEKSLSYNRNKILNDINSKKFFFQKDEFIDKKIEFDQRFFSDGYQEFQLMISDVRAQLKINEEILKMKQLIEKQNERKIERIHHSMQDEISKDDLQKALEVINEYADKQNMGSKVSSGVIKNTGFPSVNPDILHALIEDDEDSCACSGSSMEKEKKHLQQAIQILKISEGLFQNEDKFIGVLKNKIQRRKQKIKNIQVHSQEILWAKKQIKQCSHRHSSVIEDFSEKFKEHLDQHYKALMESQKNKMVLQRQNTRKMKQNQQKKLLMNWENDGSD